MCLLTDAYMLCCELLLISSLQTWLQLVCTHIFIGLADTHGFLFRCFNTLLTYALHTSTRWQVDDFHTEAAAMMSELDALTPRSRINGHMTSTSANHHHHSASPPSFTLKLKDCEVEEGESFDLQCTTQGILTRSLCCCWLYKNFKNLK